MQRKSIYKAAAAAVVLLLVYALLGFALIPYLIQRSLPQYVQENLGVQSSIGTVRFNPFLLKLEASDFRLAGQAEEPTAAFKHLLVDLELVGILHWAWTFKDIQLDGLEVNAELGRDGRLNLVQLADYWTQHNPAKPDSKPARAIIQHLQVAGAIFTFTDQSAPQPAAIRSDAINFDVSDLTTLPDREGRYALSGRLADGGAVSWRGDLSLQPIASSGEWQIENVKLASLWQFFRDELKIAEPEGALSFSGRYRFSYDAGSVAVGLEALHAKLAKLSIARSGEERPVIALETVEASDARYDLAKNELIVPQIKLSSGTLSARMSKDGNIDWQALVTAPSAPKADAVVQKRASSPLHARIESIIIDEVGLHYTDETRAESTEYRIARLDAGLKLDIATESDNARVAVEDLHLSAADTQIGTTDSDQPLVQLKSVMLDGGQVNTSTRNIVIPTLTAKGGSIAITHVGGGFFGLVQMFAAAQSLGKPAARSDRPEEPWKYAVHAADFSEIELAVTDRTYKPPVQYETLASGSLKNISGDAKQPLEFGLNLRSTRGGTVQAGGTMTQDFAQVSAKLEISGLGAEPLRPVLLQYTILDLKSATASATARVEYRRGGKPETRIQGTAQIADLLLNEAASGERFLAWKSLDAADVALTLSPNRLAIKDVRVDQLGAKIAIAKDRSINLTQVLKPQGDAHEQTTSAESTNERFPVRVARIGLRRSTVDFADNSLVLPFSTRVTSIDGAIVGLSSYPKSRAELKLEGNIDPNGSAHASGSLQPADPKAFTDINVRFDNVEMPPLSPYTATFAGRKIAAGRLWVEVQYKIADSQLLGENKISMSDFQLGERVESPTALDLPLDLAVALLKEPDGRIQLAVPVRGDLNNPKFDYGTLIRDAIGNVLRRIVTAPFRFIAGLFGGRADEDLQSITFEPGSARLIPSEREQLEKVAQALKGRQQLKLVVHGAYDPQADARALRDTQVRRELVQALGSKVGEREDPGPIAFDDPDTQRALEKMMTARAGSDAVEKLASEYAKNTGKEVQRVNPVLAVFRRGRGDRPFYEALFQRLVDMQPLADTVLADLAAQRARSITDYLAKTGIDSARITAGKTETVEGGKAPAAKLTLEAA